tara:strand:+ start:533 stop:925 length:393 start_codon:yes stop_codon:yes gene_type:complete
MASVLRYILFALLFFPPLDSDTRQDVYNYLGEGCVGNLFDKEDFYVRKSNTQGVASKHPQHGELFGEHAFTVRGLRLLGNPRLRQLRAVCNSELCPVGRPWNVDYSDKETTENFKQGTIRVCVYCLFCCF